MTWVEFQQSLQRSIGITMLTTPLFMIPKGSSATIHAIVPIDTKDAVAQRLYDLGFTPGESVQVIARTPFKAGPIAVKLGLSRFALRQSEAARILVIQDNP